MPRPRAAYAALWIASSAVFVACGGSAVTPDGAGGSGGDAAGASSAGATGPGTGGDSGTAEPSVPAYAFTSCIGPGLDGLMIEVPPNPYDGCAPPPNVNPAYVLLMFIEDWDGTAGTWTLNEPNPKGDAHASFELESLVTGTFELEPLDAGQLTFVRWDLVVEGEAFTGYGDLRDCAPSPCP